MAMQMLNGDKGHGPVVLSLMRSASARRHDLMNRARVQ